MKGIYINGIAYFSNGTTKFSRQFRTKEAFSNWANKQFSIDEKVTIDEYKLDVDNDFECKLVSTWRA